MWLNGVGKGGYRGEGMDTHVNRQQGEVGVGSYWGGGEWMVGDYAT